MKTAKELLNEKWRGATNTENYFIALEIIEYAEEQAKNLYKPLVSDQVCDHIRETDGMKCTGGRCSKCEEIV